MPDSHTKTPEADSVRIAMDEAWREHQHARDQTWSALKLVILLVAGLVAIEVRFHSRLATVCTAVLVIAESIAGLLIAKHHREYQIKKFTHIMQCEEWLGLRDSGLISDVEKPEPIAWSDLIKLNKQNTVLFIMRMHLGIIAFAVLFTLASLFLSHRSP